MRKFILIIFIVQVFITSNILGQEVPIKGVVKDATTKEFLPGANVYVQGTTNGTITDIDGNFTINAKVGDTLICSFIGFNDKKVYVNGGQNILVYLESTIAEVDEVVVIGYGYVKKSDLTGSVASIGEDLMKQTTNVSVLDALKGRLAGVQVTSSEGGPGGGLNFKIRGASTLSASSQPLYVIDGIPLEIDEMKFSEGEESTPGAPENPLNDIDPANIESIEILKDASATAIYGSRGANGVVLITTKSGHEGKSTVSFSSSTGIQRIAKKVDLLDGPGYAKFMYANTGSDKYAYWEDWEVDSMNTDWQDEMYGIGVIQDYNLSVSGGNEQTKYTIGGGYFNNKGIIGRTNNKGFDRYSANMSVNQMVGDKFTIIGKFSIGATNNNGVSTGGNNTPKTAGVVRQILRSPPNRNSDPDDINEELENDMNQLENPNKFVKNVDRVNKSSRILGKVEAQYNVMEGVKITSRFGANYKNKQKFEFYPNDIGKGKKLNGVAQIGNGENFRWVSETFLNIDKSFGLHKINGMVAYTVEKGNSFVSDMTAIGFNSTEISGYYAMRGAEGYYDMNSEYKASSLMSYLGRIQYNFNERYLASFSMRADGTSRLINHRWGYFPSTSFAWRMSEEAFFDPLKLVMSTSKLRMSYGVTGNQRIPENAIFAPYEAVFKYTLNGSPVSAVIGEGVYNPNAKWERTQSFNLGWDFGFFNDKITSTFDWYYKLTDGMLMRVPLPETTGYPFVWDNLGVMANKGIEFSLNALIMDRKDFSWTSDFNITFNRNNIESLNIENDYFPVKANNTNITEFARVEEGYPIGVWYGYETNGIYKDTVDVSSNSLYAQIGNWRIVDQDGNDTIDSRDRTIIGIAEPKHYGGFVNSFRYKQFTLDIFLTWRYGGDILNGDKIDLNNMSAGTKFNRGASVLDAWVPEDIMRIARDGVGNPRFDENGNPIEEVAIPANPDSNRPGFGSTTSKGIFIDDYLEDGSYLRVQAITLSYSIPKKLLRKVNVKKCNVYGRVENLYTLTKYSGKDPEVDMDQGTNGLSPGIDYGAYPRVRTFTFGLNVKF